MFMRNLSNLAIIIVVLATAFPAFAVDGLITKPSANSFDVTIERFEASAKRRGFIVFAHLDHAAVATSAGLKMPRSTVVVFGNPLLGTPIFIRTPTVAIDLPLKALVWEDSTGKVFLSYNSAEFVLGPVYARHGIQVPNGASEQLENTLASIAKEAIQ